MSVKCVCECVSVFVYECMNMCVNVCVCINVWVCVWLCVCVNVWVCVCHCKKCVSVYACVWMCTHAHMHVCVCVGVCVLRCVQVHMCAGQRSIFSIMAQEPSTLFYKTESLRGSWELLARLGWLTSRPPGLFISVSSLLGFQACDPVPGFLCECQISELGYLCLFSKHFMM